MKEIEKRIKTLEKKVDNLEKIEKSVIEIKIKDTDETIRIPFRVSAKTKVNYKTKTMGVN